MNTWDDHAADALEELHLNYGITGWANTRHRCLIISTTDCEYLKTQMPYRTEPNAWWKPADAYLRGITITTAPDWTCNPTALAEARFIATVLTGLHIPQLVRRLNRLLTKKARP